MTCREAFRLKYPDRGDPDEIGECPDVVDIFTEPHNCNARTCTNLNAETISCKECWDREIPGTERIDADMCTNRDYYTPKYDIEDGVTEEMKQQILEESKPHILDSGNRREFGTGAVRDIQEGKGRCDLLPLDVVARYLEDEVLDKIASFQKTGSVDALYVVLWMFAPHWGSTEHMNVSNSTMLLEVAKHYEEGCNKYGARNWEKGIPVRCYIDSAVRHYLKFVRGDKDEPHDRAFCWNILGAIWTCGHKPELCEYPIKLEGEG